MKRARLAWILGARIGMILVEGNEWEGEGRLLEGGTWLQMYGTRRDKYTNNSEVSLFFLFLFVEGFESVEA